MDCMTGETDNTKHDDLAARIRQAEKGSAAPGDEKRQTVPRSSRAGYDFVGSMIGGAVLGWALDAVFPFLSPWGIIGMMMLGFVAGIMSVWRGLATSE
jgi:F0F1-type ATP synthase assembly protein I